MPSWPRLRLDGIASQPITATQVEMKVQTNRSTRPTPAESLDDSVTVAVASRRLGCDATTVRALLRGSEISGHRVGKGKDPRGVRVHLSSIRDYIVRNLVAGDPANDNVSAQPTQRPRQRSVVHDAAMAELQAMGVTVRKTP